VGHKESREPLSFFGLFISLVHPTTTSSSCWLVLLSLMAKHGCMADKFQAHFFEIFVVITIIDFHVLKMKGNSN
jgi:hypothetical protein